ncbi:MAG: hypothetical protein HKP44_11175 [Desulfofustis sp.]|nr:hypothetical protein [Desulfofustis sp.]
MSIEQLDFVEPFFTVKYLVEENSYRVEEPCILINLSEQPITIENQQLAFLQSVVVTNIAVKEIKRGLIVERFASYEDEAALYEEVKKVWPLAYDIRKEQRLKGVSHYISPKAILDNVRLNMYHSGSVPLNVGLHKDHVHCGEMLLKEVHTQIVGYGKMQQCLEKDITTLYLEEPMAPGSTHKPIYDENGNYPWHQYETITPAIFLAIEVLPPETDAAG